MKKELYQSDQPILADDLERAQSTKEEAIRERQSDSFSAGIIKGALNEFALSVNIVNLKTIDIGTGVAYDPSGERIAITDDTVFYVNPIKAGAVLSSGDPSIVDATPNGPLTLSDDGIGGFTLTPQVSGCKRIPLENLPNYTFSGSYAYIYIAYLRTTDPLVYVLQKVTNKRLFVSALDGYEIKLVDTLSLVDPATINPDIARFLYLGYVDFRTGANLSAGNLNSASRSYVTLDGSQFNAVTADAAKTNRTIVYGNDQTVTVQEHIRAVGSGNITPTNPHGTTSADLGITGKNVEQHEQLFHASGIIGDQYSTSSALYGSVNIVAGAPNPPTYGIDTFKISPLSSSQYAYINTVTLDSGDISILNEFYFLSATGVLLADGIYRLFLNNSTKTIRMAVVAAAGTSTSDAGAGTTTYLGDQIILNVNGDGAQTITLNANTSDGAAVAADVQTQVRAITATDPTKQPAYDAFTASYNISTGKYTLTSGAYNAGTNTVVVTNSGIAATLKLGVANGGTETIGAGPGGTYRRAIGGVFTDLTTEDAAIVAVDNNNLMLWDVTFVGSAGPGVGSNNIPTKTDVRTFGTLGSKDLSRDSATDNVTIDHNVTITKNLTVAGSIAAASVDVAPLVPGDIRTPAGAVTAFAGATLPAGWLECDGSSYLRANYPALVTAITDPTSLQPAWGYSDSLHFYVPDFRGVFLRGWTHGAGDSFIDPDASSRTSRLTNGVTGNKVGSYQLDDFKDHQHHYDQPGGGSSSGGNPNSIAINYGALTYTTTNINPGNETRAKNASVMYIIKY